VTESVGGLLVVGYYDNHYILECPATVSVGDQLLCVLVCECQVNMSVDGQLEFVFSVFLYLIKIVIVNLFKLQMLQIVDLNCGLC